MEDMCVLLRVFSISDFALSLTLFIRLSKGQQIEICFGMCTKWSEWNVIDIDWKKTVALWLLALNELIHTPKCDFCVSLQRITGLCLQLLSEWIFIFRFIYPFNLSSNMVVAPLSLCCSRFAYNLSNACSRVSCSLDDNIEEFVPVRRLKAGKAHGETLDFLYYVVLYVKVFDPTFIWVSY